MSHKRRARVDEVQNEKRAKIATTHAGSSDALHRCGKVLRMKLINFMCHSNLVIDFHSNINFLVGRNGSGKSAILSALVLGLGCKASVTSRSTNFKQFIKTDESYAVIEIVLDNSGPGAYDRESYGNKILVSRRITATGASTYKLKSEKGNLISSSTDDLRKMLMFLNIQADNPVFVLNQDNARSFLKDLDCKKNYEFFLKATQIESIINSIFDSEELLQNLNVNYQYSIEQSKNLQLEIDELKQMYMRLETAENAKSLIKQYTNEKNWAKVIEIESTINDIHETITQIESDKKKKAGLITDKDSLEKNIKDNIKELDNDMLEKNASVQNENSVENKLREELSKRNDVFLNVQQQSAKLKANYVRCKGQIVDLQNHIKEREISLNANSTQSLREQNENQIEKLKTDLREVEARIENTKLEIQMLLETKQQSDEEYNNNSRQCRRLVDEVRHYKSQLAEIKLASQDNLSIYGPHVSRFVEALKNAHKAGQLSEMPLGPIGRYITIPNEKYRCIIETILSNILPHFIVNNTSDRNVIDAILNKSFRQYNPSIITNKFHKEVYNVNQGKVNTSPGTHLLMNEINCSSNVVMNILIDRCSIETILLTEDQSIAVHLTEAVENVPRNLFKIYLVNPGVEFYPATISYRMYSLQLREPRYIQVNTSQRLKQVSYDLTQKMNLVRIKEKELKENKSQIEGINDRLNKNKALVDRHDQTKRDIKEKIEEIESIEYPDNNEFDILSSELNELNLKCTKFSSDIQTSEALIEKTKAEKIEAESKLKVQKNKMRILKDKIDEIQEENVRLNASLKSLTNTMKLHENEIKQLEEEIKKQRSEETVLLKALKLSVTTAENCGTRVETEKSEKELDALVLKFEKQLKQNSKNVGNKDDIKILIEEKQCNLQVTVDLITTIKETLQTLAHGAKVRKGSIKNLKKCMSIRVQFIFERILRIRGFTGEIIVNHDEKMLSVNVIPRDSGVADAVKNTKSLSGGERSFTTVAFLLSLWSCIDHPFHFLDEYDVFTDKVNQGIMTTLLIEEAKNNKNRQYTFLTPQDTAVKSSDLIQIHRLIDPIR